MNKNILITAVICVSILGGSYYAVQVSKQNSIERQQKIELEEKQRIRQEELEIRHINEKSYNWCVVGAEKDYWDFMKLNGTENKDGSITALDKYWDRAEKNKKEAVNNCYNRYLK